MSKKLAKLKYLPNNFQIIQEGDHVVCAVSGKKIELDKYKVPKDQKRINTYLL